MSPIGIEGDIPKESIRQWLPSATASCLFFKLFPTAYYRLLFYYFFFFAAIEKNDTNQQNKYHFHSTQLNFDWDARVCYQFSALLKKFRVRSQASSEAFST